MRVIVAEDAARDIELADAWWQENRTDTPSLLRTSVADGLESLADVGPSLPVFRTLSRGTTVRRMHLARVHKHLYFVVRDDRLLVLAVWGAVRGLLPALRARLGRV
jgi:plasmid stabilization system protein ParE